MPYDLQEKGGGKRVRASSLPVYDYTSHNRHKSEMKESAGKIGATTPTDHRNFYVRIRTEKDE